MTRTRIDWRGGRDGTAHAHTRAPRTLCGLNATPERLAWPSARRCLACEVLAKQQEAGASCRP